MGDDQLISPRQAAREKLKEDYIKSLGLKDRSPPARHLPKLKERVTQLENIIASESSSTSADSKLQQQFQTELGEAQQPPDVKKVAQSTPKEIVGSVKKVAQSTPKEIVGSVKKVAQSTPKEIVGSVKKVAQSTPKEIVGSVKKVAQSTPKEIVGSVKKVAQSTPKEIVGSVKKVAQSTPKEIVGSVKKVAQSTPKEIVEVCSSDPLAERKLKLKIPSIETFQPVSEAQISPSSDSAVADLNLSLVSKSSKSPHLLSKPADATFATQKPLEPHLSSSGGDSGNIPVERPQTLDIGPKGQNRGKVPPPVSPKPLLRRKPDSLNTSTNTYGHSKPEETIPGNDRFTTEDSLPCVNILTSTNDHTTSIKDTGSSDQCEPVSSSDESGFTFDVKSIVARFSKSIQSPKSPRIERQTAVDYSQLSPSLPYIPLPSNNTKPCPKICVDKESHDEEETGASCQQPSDSRVDPNAKVSIVYPSNEDSSCYPKDPEHLPSKFYLGISEKEYVHELDCKTNPVRVSPCQSPSIGKIKTIDFSTDQKSISKTFTDKERAFIVESISNSESNRLFRRNSSLKDQDEVMTSSGLDSMSAVSNTKEPVEPKRLPDSIIKRFDFSKETECSLNKDKPCPSPSKKEIIRGPKNIVQLGAERFQKMVESQKRDEKTLRGAKEKQAHSDVEEVTSETRKIGQPALNEFDSGSKSLEHIASGYSNSKIEPNSQTQNIEKTTCSTCYNQQDTVSFTNATSKDLEIPAASAPTSVVASASTSPDVASVPISPAVASASTYDFVSLPTYDVVSLPTTSDVASVPISPAVASAPTYDVVSLPTYDVVSLPTYDVHYQHTYHYQHTMLYHYQQLLMLHQYQHLLTLHQY